MYKHIPHLDLLFIGLGLLGVVAVVGSQPVGNTSQPVRDKPHQTKQEKQTKHKLSDLDKIDGKTETEGAAKSE